jgi:hypothetical protein
VCEVRLAMAKLSTGLPLPQEIITVAGMSKEREERGEKIDFV